MSQSLSSVGNHSARSIKKSTISSLPNNAQRESKAPSFSGSIQNHSSPRFEFGDIQENTMESSLRSKEERGVKNLELSHASPASSCHSHSVYSVKSDGRIRERLKQLSAQMLSSMVASESRKFPSEVPSLNDTGVSIPGIFEVENSPVGSQYYTDVKSRDRSPLSLSHSWKSPSENSVTDKAGGSFHLLKYRNCFSEDLARSFEFSSANSELPRLEVSRAESYQAPDLQKKKIQRQYEASECSRHGHHAIYLGSRQSSKGENKIIAELPMEVAIEIFGQDFDKILKNSEKEKIARSARL
eukprot:GHVP01031984.1.p1 GENE.GHVP01031984.1~~GHVP01031984.1.p1  ORF type:complete len:344 (+),score=67.07 GHVP01031984.1:137-1033(+)